MRLTASLIALAAAGISPAVAETTGWAGGSSFTASTGVQIFGDNLWSNLSNWDPNGGFPTMSHDVNIGLATDQFFMTPSTGIIIARPQRYDQVLISGGFTAQARSLYIGFSGDRALSGSFGQGWLNISGGRLDVAQDLVVGSTGEGVLNNGQGTVTVQSGSVIVGSSGKGTFTNNAGSALTVASGSVTLGVAATGTFTNSGSVVVNGGHVTVGVAGTSTFTNSGTMNVGTGNLVIGSTAAARGTYTNSGTLGVGGSLVVGNGSFQNTGTISNIDGSLVIGRDGASDFSNGSSALTVGQDLVAGEFANGTLTTGSNITVRGDTAVGRGSGVAGVITLNGGADLSTTGSLTVGEHGSGTINTTAGSNISTTGAVSIGLGSSSAGTVNIVAGNMTNGSTLTVGGAGTGSLTVNGDVSTDEAVSIGLAETGHGTVSITGSMTNGNSLTVGGDGTGVLRVSGGVNTTGDVSIGSGETASGTVTIGGSMTSGGSLVVGGARLGALSVDGNVSTTGAVAIGLRDTGDGSVSVGGNMVTGDTLTVGGDGSGALTVEGTLTTTETAAIGSGETGYGSVHVRGTMTTSQGNLIVGGDGTGELSVGQAGGARADLITTAGSVAIASGHGSQGVVDVWNGDMITGADLAVGGGGSGSLIIHNGKLDTSGNVIVAANEPSEGHVSVTNGDVTTGADMIVGGGGDATLVVSGGGSILTDGNAVIAHGETSESSVTLGDGGDLSTGMDLVVGHDGNATLEVSGGGSILTDGNAVIAHGETSESSVTLGDGGDLSTGMDLVVGHDGDATLEVSGGGSILTAGNAVIAHGSTSESSVTLGGGGDLSTGMDLVVGHDGDATLSVSGGGSILTADNAVIAHGETSESSVTLSDGGHMITGKDLVVGHHGDAVLTVTDGGGVLTLGNMAIALGETGTSAVSITGGGNLDTTRDLMVGGDGDATLTVTEGHITTGGNVTIAAGETSTSYVTLTDGDMWTGGTLTVGGDGDATLTVAGGDISTTGAVTIAAGETSTSVVTLTGGDMTNGDTLTVGGDGFGTLNIGTAADLRRIETQGAVVLGAGATGEGIVNLHGHMTNHDTLTVAENGKGRLDINANSSVTTDGAVSMGTGATSSAEVNVHGTMSNGDSLTLGENGKAVLHIHANGLVETDGRVAMGVGSTGEAEVTVEVLGRMLNHDTLTIEQYGEVYLTVNGADPNTRGFMETDGRVMVAEGANSRAHVENIGGEIVNRDSMVLADQGYAWYRTRDFGYTQTDGDVTVAKDTTGVGIIVTSNKASMHNGGRLDLGYRGEGYLVVDRGGKVDNTVAVMANEEDSKAYAVITGTDSTWDNRESLTIARKEGAHAVLVINEDGVVAVDNSKGAVLIAAQQGSTGILNIGAMSPVGEDYQIHEDVEDYLAEHGLSDTSSAARKAGTLEAEWVQFGEGSGTINFKHSDDAADDYRFIAGLVGGSLENSAVNHYEGFTVFDGDSSGYTGAATVQGGTLVINGTLAAGKLTVEENGTLRIGHMGGKKPGDGTTGEVIVDIVNDGLVEFNRSNDYVYSKGISGTGDVHQIGTEKTILTGENTYTGETRIFRGKLQLGDGGTGGSIDNTSRVDIETDGTLIFDRSDEKEFHSEISGTGHIEHNGSGKTILTADNSSFAGRTDVNDGTLQLATGAILGGQIHVNDGGTVAGTGTVGDTFVYNGGTISPGPSIGTFNIAGDLTQYAGSTYQVELLSTGAADLIDVSGSATIEAGSILNISKLDPAFYALEHRYAVLAAAGGLTGEYELAGDTWVSTFYGIEDQYDENNVYLVVGQQRDFSEAAWTPNQGAAADAAQELKDPREPGTSYPINELFRAIAYLQTDEEARNAFDQISGEIHASTRGALLDESRFLRAATTNRLRAAFGDKSKAQKVLVYQAGIDIKDPTPMPVWLDADEADWLALWTQAYGAWGELKGDGNAMQLDHLKGGMLVGADLPLSKLLRIGLVGGYTHSTFDVEDRNSSAKSHNFHIGAYGGLDWGGLGLRLGADYTHHALQIERNVSFPGYTDFLSSEYAAGTAQIYGDLGYTFEVSRLKAEPFGALAYVNLDGEGYTEVGRAAALHGAGGQLDALYGTLGLRASSVFELEKMDLRARAMGAWRHSFEDQVLAATHSFAGSSTFTVYGPQQARDVWLLELGVDALVSADLELGLSYAGMFERGLALHGVHGNMNWKF
ncbi:autotransporter domain-containing protein [Chelativorans sp. Marseille-P2723]|uniref:autotransporter domain-containing protein n=1 Tax=Chelativorans sp. Marseille-P2723 TaxID=2709133 RepID=UPI0015715A8C|nr:autotransporter domain-containing protein [Chelativorans sp. Marseille-P2723]